MIRHVGLLLLAASLGGLVPSPARATPFVPAAGGPPVVREIPRRPIDESNFPGFEAIRGNVDFWRQVYAVWGMGQVAVHDLRYPAVIYEVVDLPGAVEERYTEEQADFVDALKTAWRDRLVALEQKVDAGAPLSDAEKRWALQLTQHAGSTAVAGAHERLRTQRGLRERFRRGLEIGYRFDETLRTIFREAGLPEDLAILPHVESSFQAHARSSAGAVGAWQFTRSAGRRYLKMTAAVDQRLDPIAAARGAACYLADAFAELGDWPIALTSYNHGVAGMRRAIKQVAPDYERIFAEYTGRSFGFASKNFYAEFLAAREIAADPIRFFPEGIAPEPQIDFDRTVLDAPHTPAGVARMFGLAVADLAAINPAWTGRAVGEGLHLPAGLEIWLPRGTLTQLRQQPPGANVEAARRLLDPPEPDDSPVQDEHYFVRGGDTLSTIARAHGMSLATLRDLNRISPGRDTIRVGQRLAVQPGPGTARATVQRTATVPAVHVVRSGDTLSTVARRYGLSVGQLRRHNGLTAGHDLIRVGQKLHLRPSRVEQQVHVVRPGETLARIASSYGVKLMDLLRQNRLTLAAVIRPGQTLHIPLAH